MCSSLKILINHRQCCVALLSVTQKWNKGILVRTTSCFILFSPFYFIFIFLSVWVWCWLLLIRGVFHPSVQWRERAGNFLECEERVKIVSRLSWNLLHQHKAVFVSDATAEGFRRPRRCRHVDTHGCTHMLHITCYTHARTHTQPCLPGFAMMIEGPQYLGSKERLYFTLGSQLLLSVIRRASRFLGAERFIMASWRPHQMVLKQNEVRGRVPTDCCTTIWTDKRETDRQRAQHIMN